MAAPKTHVSREFGPIGHHLRGANRRRVLILTLLTRRFVEPLAAALAPLEVRVFAGAKVHVPVEVLDAADAELGDADAIIAIGGGAAIGLGKALRVRHPDLAFVAIPTTFSGSEMTTMFGTTAGTSKQTGRLPAAQPDDVFYLADRYWGLYQ